MKLSHQKGRGKKIHLLLDEEYQITTDIDFWAEHYIKDGTEIEEDEWQALVAAINYRKAVNKCFDLLSRRDHSEKELKTKLLRTVDADSADRAIAHMRELGYLDDKKYAAALLQHLIENKKMSEPFIRQEMRKRGVPADIIADVMCDTEIDNVASIVTLIVNKYRMKLQAENGKDKVIAALMRKGFSYSDIKAAFCQIEEDEDAI